MVSMLWISALVFTVTQAVITEEDGVWVLNEANFEEALLIQPNLLVDFYAPWCSHCMTLAPEYSRAAKRLMQHTPPIRIAKVDATTTPNLSQLLSINGYPTLKFFEDKVPTDYTGERTEQSIYTWVLKKSTPSAVEGSSAEDIERFISKNKLAAVLFSQKTTQEAKIFEAVSKSVDGIGFLLSTNSAVLEKYGVKEPALIIFKTFDDRRTDYTGDFSQVDITTFLNNNRLPWAMPFSDEVASLIFREMKPALFLFSKTIEPYKSDLDQIGKETKGVLLVSYGDIAGKGFERLSDYLGVKPRSQPLAMIVDPRGELKKYKSTESLDIDGFRKFVNDWKSSKLRLYFKSAEIPANSYEDDVRIIVGNNFAEVVLDTTKDVFVEVYASWCGHCQTLAPEYRRLAAELKDNKNIIIAKMDGNDNEVPEITIQGFPSLKFFPANNKKGIEFNGNKNFESMLSFVKENASNKVDEFRKLEL